MHNLAVHLCWFFFFFLLKCSVFKEKNLNQTSVDVWKCWNFAGVVDACFSFVYLELKFFPWRRKLIWLISCAVASNIAFLCHFRNTINNGYILNHGKYEHVNLWHEVVLVNFSTRCTLLPLWKKNPMYSKLQWVVFAQLSAYFFFKFLNHLQAWKCNIGQ